MWEGNPGLKIMKKSGFVPGMGLGDGNGRNGSKWGVQGRWVSTNSPDALNALTMAVLLSPSPHTDIPPLLSLGLTPPPFAMPVPPPSLAMPPPPFAMPVPPPSLSMPPPPHTFSLAPPDPKNCHPARGTSSSSQIIRYSLDGERVLLEPVLGKGWGRRFPVETPDRCWYWCCIPHISHKRRKRRLWKFFLSITCKGNFLTINAKNTKVLKSSLKCNFEGKNSLA